MPDEHSGQSAEPRAHNEPTTDPGPAAGGGGDSARDTWSWSGKHPEEHDFGIDLAEHVQLEEYDAEANANGRSGLFDGGLGPASDFGKYELICELGRGGMGVVYKARHKELGRLVAIKMILSNHLASPEHVERFYAEARAAARVESPSIVGIHDVGQIHGQHYFAMDYVAGPSLATVARKGPLEPKIAARYVYSVARAVAHLHAQGIVHRDIKPSNVLLDPDGRPRVTDFGLAKMLSGEGGDTRSGAIIGTPCYMPPEQAAGKAGGVGPASDLYSLGAILFELLTGRPPYTGKSALDTLVQVLESEPPRPGRIAPGIPRALETICLRCLEREPADRYPSAAALAEDLDHYLRGEPLEARPRGIWHNLRRWARREPALASRLGTMLVCGTIFQINHYAVQPMSPGPYQHSLLVVLLWAFASILFQGVLSRSRWTDLARYTWATTDVVLFTLLVAFNHGVFTSLVSGYFLLVAASGLWFREHLVWMTTVLSVFGYTALVLRSGFGPPMQIENPYRNVIFVAALGVSGLVTGYQVKRVRALSLYYEHRPLP